METKMKIEVWSDVICPFCYIGKRNFEAALKRFANKEDVELSWKCFQLDPDIEPNLNLSTAEYLSKRKGMGVTQVNQLLHNVTEMAAKSGLDFRMDKAIISNSMNAHRLSCLAAKYNKQNEAEELLFETYFVKGKNIDDKQVLMEVAEQIGISREAAGELVNSNAFEQAVFADIAEAEHFNIKGVPFFVFNRKYAISGAQHPDTFLEVLETSFKAWQTSEI
ncbi:MAG: DsbA family oxidoreductase [Bacteroidetes bacterium]|nr:DsbA family oxidoreductase [Bacteroidota bacterium]